MATKTPAEAATAAVRADLAAGPDRAQGIVDKLTTFESALRDLCGTLMAHNEQVAAWGASLRAAGVPDLESPAPNLPGVAHRAVDAHAADVGEVHLGRKVYAPIPAGQLVGATVFRVLSEYPAWFARYQHSERVTDLGDLIDSPGYMGGGGPVDLVALIRRDA